MITLTPAYGRDYKSAKAAKESYAANQDWILNDMQSRWDGKLINRQQVLEAYSGTLVQLRFGAMRKQTIIKP